MTSCNNTSQVTKQYEYGVFLGISEDKISRLEKYKTVVIEPQEFSKKSIEKLHNDKKFVYGYLNIGAIENYPQSYKEKNFDGLFLDNFDVYYHYARPEIFKGLCDICTHLKSLGFKLLINGGDTFVSKCIQNNNTSSYFDGINQETVFTSINFKNKTYGKQKAEQHEYFTQYLKSVKQTNLSVYLLEYSANSELLKEIDEYCKENGFGYYNAPSLELK
ncbi:glucanotransferase [Plasmodium falciparum IGH-CR14]|uniref:Glucanotransferase n=1 Tax=Plasmodium falciparum IGH-CR14 TaxID=580059 RepID=A0A0L1II36_PLAFA|nr:glucanotransferase [Plasmodium falciparum IGH-CR14]